MPEQTNLTIITAIKPKRLSKGFTLGIGGDLLRSQGGNLAQGIVETLKIDSLPDLGNILTSLTPAQALVYGVPINGATRILTRKAFAEAGKPAGATTRTNDAFSWPDGHGVMMLDYDPPSGRDALGRDALVSAIRQAAPGLAGSAMLWWSSASSCIWHSDIELRGIKGQRLYLLAQDAADIPRAGKVLVDRLWLTGQGHIEISKSGSLLERTLVDASVWQQSRLDFAGGAACGDGLKQRRGDPIIIEGKGEPIDTRAALPDLAAGERDALALIKAEAKGAALPEAEGVKDHWIAARVQEMVSRADVGDREKIQEAESIARRALETGDLAGDFAVPVELDGKMEMVPVGKLLDNRNRYHGCMTRDPLEPEYDGARLVGRLFLLQARPVLHSFAHGGKAYRLHRAPARVELVKGHTAEAATATIDLLRRDPVAFDFGGQLALADDGRVHPLCEHGLAHHLGTVTQFWKMVTPGDTVVPVDCDPPSGLLKQIIAQGERRKLKPLAGVITGPTIRLDGSILLAPGYDAKTRLLFDPMGDGVPDVPMRPTEEQARSALDTLIHPFETFPFVDPAARGALLAAILTAVVRPVLPTAPAFAFDAPIQGSGKTLLATCVGALTEGRVPDVWPHTQGRDDEETRKRLFTALRTGCRALVWDNVTGIFDSASMAAFITADAMVDRVLGKSESMRIPNRALLILTGNNLQLAGDLPRRVIMCRIDPETDQPFARQFDIDPLAHVLEHRMAMLTAACTLIRARFTHEMTPAPGRLASFEAWDDLVRQTVVWAEKVLRPFEFGDPMDLVRQAQAADPEADALFALLDALRSQFHDAEFSAKEVMAAMPQMTPGSIETAIVDLAGDKTARSARSLGRVLKFREGRIVHGLRLKGRQDKNSGSRIYRIQTVESAKYRFNGDNGSSVSHTEKPRPPVDIDGGK
ncbi:hypothetical protein M3N55_15530 [Roseibaca sp. V10]|uniref:DUF927 domain-containing protein n=1 Tax=Roseinatronobacter domitianus TaxID=2940293 RepID=A0ABT0M5K1_9RHOB|nr:hypothetical protein [Roseibaca domitiana]MCL1630135.1 hypothetical protein [Roseibaca domitiana]